MQDAQSFTATEFKAKCLDILDRVAAHKFTRVTITKRGKIVAVLTPPEDPEAVARRERLHHRQERDDDGQDRPHRGCLPRR